MVASTPNALAFSRDGGMAWKSVALPSYVSTVQGVALSPSAIWISSRAGVFYSKDNGVTWEHVLVGAPPQNLMSVRYDRAAAALARADAAPATSTPPAMARPGAAPPLPASHIRSLSVAGGRLLGITPFRGIVAQPESQAQLQAASADGAR